MSTMFARLRSLAHHLYPRIRIGKMSTVHNKNVACCSIPPVQSNYTPKGSFKPSATPVGGFGLYLGGPSGFDFTTVDEVLFSYAVYFPAGFQWKYVFPLPRRRGDSHARSMGGKLPGPCTRCVHAHTT